MKTEFEKESVKKKAEAKDLIQLTLALNVKPDAKPNAKPNVKPDAKPNVKPDAKPNSNPS